MSPSPPPGCALCGASDTRVPVPRMMELSSVACDLARRPSRWIASTGGNREGRDAAGNDGEGPFRTSG
jgi:hypothetical protein